MKKRLQGMLPVAAVLALAANDGASAFSMSGSSSSGAVAAQVASMSAAMTSMQSTVSTIQSTMATTTYVDGQVSSVQTSVAAFPSKTYVDGQVSSLATTLSSVSASIPQPASTAPLTDATAAVVGSAATFMRSDSVRPSRYRSGTCTISNGLGTCTVTWSTAFAVTPNPVGDPSAVNSVVSTSLIQCNYTSVTTTGATVACKQPLITASISIGSLTLFPNAANGTVVSANAIQPM